MGFMKAFNVGRTLGRIPSRRFIDFGVDAFFDSSVVQNSVDKVTRRALQMAAADTRKHAQRSMKTAPVGSSAPAGMPPHKHRHSGRGKKSSQDYGLMRSIMYAYDTMTESAVVGPSSVRGDGIHAIAERHEFGGRITQKNKRRRLRKLGGSGEIRVEGVRDGEPESKKLKIATKTATETLLGTVEVTYGKLFTQEQMRRANRLNAALYGPAILHGSYPERKFMLPSLEKIAPQLPDYFVKAVK